MMVSETPLLLPLHNIGIFLSDACTSFVHIIMATILPSSKNTEYINFAEVEFRHDGHAAQKQDAADDVMQQARLPRDAIHILDFLVLGLDVGNENES